MVCPPHTGAMTRPSFALHNAFLLLLVAVVIVCLSNTTVPAEREWVKFLLDWHEEISVSKQTSVLLYMSTSMSYV